MPKFKKSFKNARFNQKKAVCGVFVCLTLVSVTLTSVLLLSCRKGVGAGPGEDIAGGVTVQGTVSSVLTGGPLSGATVTLMQHSEPIETTQTSGDGSYSFTGIEAGAGYTVIASASIYIGSATAVFTVSETHVEDITLDRDWPSVGTVAAETAYGVGGIAFAPDGTMYFTTDQGNKIRKRAPGGTIAEDYAGTGDEGVDDDSLADATFSTPRGIAVSADGTRIYVTDTGGNRVRKIIDDEVWTIAGSGSGGDFYGEGVDAKLAHLHSPSGVAVDAAGNVYVADSWNNRIRKISAEDGIITTIAGGGGSSPALSEPLNSPTNVAVDSQGNVYITYSSTVKKITPTGAISTVVGITDLGSTIEFRNTSGIAVDAAGTMYVVDCGNNRIVKVTAEGTASVIAGNGLGTNYDQFSYPTCLAIGPDGALYIGDGGNQRIMKY